MKLPVVLTEKLPKALTGADRWRSWALIGLTAFVVLDVVLVVWAFSSVRRESPIAPGPIPTFTNVPTSAPTG